MSNDDTPGDSPTVTTSFVMYDLLVHYPLLSLFCLCNTRCMTEQPENSKRALEWTLGDRMSKAMRYADVSRAEMADYLGVGQSTVTSWTTDRIVPGLQTQRLWALRCGVGLEWLQGVEQRTPHPDGPDGGSEVRHQGLEPRTRWLSAIDSINLVEIDFRGGGFEDDIAS